MEAETRIDQHEPSNQSLARKQSVLKWALIALAICQICVVALIRVYVRRDRILSARGFEVTDSSGRRLAWLGEGPDRRAGLMLFDAGNRCRAEVAMDGTGSPALSLFDPTGHRAIAIGFTGEGATGITVESAKAPGTVYLSADGSGAGLFLAKGLGRPEAGFYIDREGKVVFVRQRAAESGSGASTGKH